MTESQRREAVKNELARVARLYAEMVALISATRAVLPPHLVRLGNLNGLMHWAAAYAEMVQHGELPLLGGVIKGAIAEKFLQTMQKRREALLLQGLSEQKAKKQWRRWARRSSVPRSILRACRGRGKRCARSVFEQYLGDRIP